MTTINELQIKVDEINKLVKDKIVSADPELSVVTDGIIDIEKYLNAKYKILWILKEPYDDFDEYGVPFGGGWGLDEVINPKQTIQEFVGGKPTFKTMIYTSWGILHDFCLWESMNDVEDDPTMLNALKSIAIINIKKIPGYSKSDYTTIKRYYQQHKLILKKQIESYDPDIIIGGNTLGFFLEDLELKGKMQGIDNDYFGYTIKNKKLYIDTLHPAQLSVARCNYVNDIIKVAKQWQTELNNGEK